MKLTETLSAIYDARLRDPDSDFWSFWFLNVLTTLLRKEKIYNQSLSKIILRESQTASKIFGRFASKIFNSLPVTELTTDILQSLR